MSEPVEANTQVTVQMLPGTWRYVRYIAPHDRQPRKVGHVTLILARPESTPEPFTIRQALEIEGNSHIAICRPAVPVDTPNRSLTFETFDPAGRTISFRGDANPEGFLGKVHLTNIPYTEAYVCEVVALRIMQPTLSLLSFQNDVPIYIWQVHVAPAGTRETFIRQAVPFFGKSHGNRQDIFPGEFQQIVPSYREALNLSQISPPLAFVLFYRVIEATEELRKPPGPDDPRIKQSIPKDWDAICTWLATVLGYTHVNEAGAKNVVPEEAVGEKYSKIVKDVLRPLRNRIAHGVITEKPGPETETESQETFSSIDDPELNRNVNIWMPLCHVLARAALMEVGGLERVEFGEPPTLAMQRRVERERARTAPSEDSPEPS